MGDDASTSSPAGGEAAARRRLRAQIAALEHALSNLTSPRAPRAAAIPEDAPAPRPRPRLLSAAELAEQRDELLRRLADAHVAG
jgi:hypothetical protein